MFNFFSNFDKVSFGCALVDVNLNIQQINAKFLSFLQKEANEIMGKNILSIIPDMKFISSSKPYQLENITRDNGQTLSIEVTKIKDGKKVLNMIFCRDITCHQELSKQIGKLNEEVMIYSQMFNALYDGIFISDENGTTIFVNDAFLLLSGLKREDVIGKSVYYLMENDIVPNSCTALVLRTKEPASTINNYYAGKSCLVSGTPVFREDRLRRIICVIRDVSELDSLRNKLNNATSLTLSYKHQLKEIELQSRNKHVMDTRSKVMKEIYERAIKIAAVDTPVLLLGETGVGKDFLASFIHEISDRAQDGHFIKINCGAIPEPLLESELFGYEPGAFTGANKSGKAGLFELANNGTLFLDEIGDMPYHLQVKLLSAIQDKKIYRLGGTKIINLHTRIITATNADLEKLIEQNKFRRDLYYRLNVINIKIPSLRDRRDDIIPLAMGFIEQFNQQYHKNRYFSPHAMEFLLNYEWPGNIREMKNTIERLVIIADQDCIEPRIFTESRVEEKYSVNYNGSIFSKDERPLKQRLAEYETNCIIDTIKNTGTLKEAAEVLDIDLSTLVRKKQKYSICKSI